MSATVVVQHANHHEGFPAATSPLDQQYGAQGFRNSVEISPSSLYPPPGPLSGNEQRPARVAIPSKNSTARAEKASVRLSPGTAGDKAMVAAASGPMSSKVVVPARPRPGRKPMQGEDQVDRRRVQNRLAQRNFRDKRQQKLKETLDALEEVRKEYEANVNALEVSLAEERKQRQDERTQLVRKFEFDLAELRRQLDAERSGRLAAERRLQNHVQPSTLGSFRPAAATSDYSGQVPSPPQEAEAMEMEMDFTSFGKSSHTGFEAGRHVDPCGFCTDIQNCACISKRPEPIEPPTTVTGAGSCADCLRDPKRAQQCRDMASRAGLASGSVPLSRKSCSTMIDEFNKFGQRTSSISTLFGGQLNAYPSSRGTGYDFEEKQAAQVLSILHQQSSKAEDDARKDSGVN